MAMALSMSTRAKGLLLFLAVVTYASGARGYTTWISNGASRAIVATTSYPGGRGISNRVVNPGTSEKDDYNYAFGINVELKVLGAVNHNNVNIQSDRSLVGYDHAAGSTGVDIYLAKFGTLFQKDGDVLLTIFLNSGHNSTAPIELS